MHRTRKLVGILVVVAILSLPLIALIKRQDIFDWWRLRGYVPTQEVANLATNTSMNAFGRKLFYVNHPKVDNLAAFRVHCTDSEASIVLGCYRANTGIFIYDVNDVRLDGIQEVTAAHEMLHAGYDRLSNTERQRVDALTAQAFAALNDERIKSTVEQYRQKDPSIVPNELHSILATEVKDLPAELETYYQKYFTDRARVVALSKQYETEFTKRKNRVDAYDTQLASLKADIESSEKLLNDQLKDLKNSRTELENLLSSGQRDQYNASVPGFNASVSNYNQLVRGVQAQITQYNQLVIERNELAKEIRDLTDAIDTRAEPQEIQ